ncbi:hypothetical protein V0U79_07880 [Hyphobacterium sp. HN65]|uniref:HEPN domain-containing protein n=1 Tax=Hyphobacterium lacteum TaxID=3116575 RepID=A0ABU7LQU1_9PROT|nr:hypothetical protein [Hyphobacterium sp. HN65]MEE2526283.1 hypothetical protein [Hyphobacterium sp. HN65]
MPTSAQEFRDLALLHAGDAKFLLEARRFSNAYHLGGYAVECALKAVLCRQFAAESLPDKGLVQAAYTHNLSELSSLAGLANELKRAKEDANFSANWGIVSAWTEASRYQTTNESEATDLVEAIDGDDGILEWIKSHWQ